MPTSLPHRCQHAALHARRGTSNGAVLIFLPGWDDISKVHELLAKSPIAPSLLLYPLHGMMPTSQQRGIFDRPPAGSGKRKVVIATNIAESSITIDDVVYVIDSGKHKEKTWDASPKVHTSGFPHVTADSVLSLEDGSTQHVGLSSSS